MSDIPAGGDLEAAKKLNEAYQRLKDELAKVIVGQEAVIDQVLTAIFARGHGLLVGVPGLAKTLLISTLSRALSLSFNRIQFTPDLMPSDITGTDILQEDPETFLIALVWALLPTRDTEAPTSMAGRTPE